MMKLIPARMIPLFSRAATAPLDFPEYSPAGRTPPVRATPARPKPARAVAFLRMAPLVLGLGLLSGPGRAVAQKPLGIDVSNYQGGSINWSSVYSSGITFAWAKATESLDFIDADFTINENNGKAAGVYMGAYHFAHPTNSPAAEAAYFWNEAGPYIKADGKTLMPMLDLEYFTGYDGASSYSDWVNQWCTAVSNYAAAAGVRIRPVLYVGPCNAGDYLNSSVAQWISDIASYNGESAQTGNPWSVCTDGEVWGSGAWNVWQYADSGSNPGDQDVFNGTSAGLVSMMVATALFTNGATYVSSSVPSGVVTGKTFTASITMNNSGSIVWTNTGANPYRLGSQNPQDNTTWGFNRVALPSSPIQPGANATFTFTATAPLTAGSYAFSWQMLQEGVQWFGGTFTTHINVVIPGPGTNYGNYTLSTNMNSTSRDANYASFSACGATGWYSEVCNASGTYFNRDIRWMPSLPPYGFTGRGFLTASALVPSTNAQADAVFIAVDASGNDLAGPLTGTVNQCTYGATCSAPTFYSNTVNLTSFGGFRSNTTNDTAASSGGCSTTCGSFTVAYSQMNIQAARWQYIDDWVCLGSYASTNVSDTSYRSFNETNLYLYPAVDTSHGNVITAGLGFSGNTPGRVTTGDCNSTNTLNFAGTNNGVSPAGNAAAYGDTNYADAYGFAWIFAPASTSPQFLIGSDDGNRFWVNGVLKNSTNASRSLTRDQDSTGAVSLPTGWSRVLFKVHNFTGSWQGTVSLRSGTNANLNEPLVSYFDMNGYYSYGLGYEQDSWYPQIVVNSLYGVSNPTNGEVFYGNNTSVTVSGTANGQAPVPLWQTMQYQWGYGLTNADSNYAPVSGTPTAANWSHDAHGVTGHRRFLFFAVSQSGRTSFQNSGVSGGSVFQDAGNYARYYDIYVDNVPPLNSSFTSVTAASTTQINLQWIIPPDQGVNIGPGSTESAGGLGNQDSQNWYRVGDVGCQVYRNGTNIISAWGTGTSLSDTGLVANTAYTYTVAAQDNNTGTRGSWHNTTGQQGSTTGWTLSVAPGAASLTASQTNLTAGQSVTWTAVKGFGAGLIQYYRYAWDTQPAHTWTDTEPQWLAGTLATTPTSSGAWYLHLKGYNGADAGNGTFDYAVTANPGAPPTVTGISLLADGNVRLGFSGQAGEMYLIQAANNLTPPITWTTISTNTADGTGSFGFSDLGATNYGYRFYRAATP
jgi:GH25 family lysozyme M1 (1,4-beta-N-acetylmuramidase)